MFELRCLISDPDRQICCGHRTEAREKVVEVEDRSIAVTQALLTGTPVGFD